MSARPPPKTAKRTPLTLKERVTLIKKFEEDKTSQRQLAAQFNVSKTQVQETLKRKAEFMSAYEENSNSDRKRLHNSNLLEKIDDMTWQWFQTVRANNLPVSGPLLQEKALVFAASLNNSDFKASNGWLMRFKNRHNIHGAISCGESGAVDLSTCDDWKAKIPDLVAGYEARDIYNMDESGVFFRALPLRTLTVKKEACKGGKQVHLLKILISRKN